MYRCYVRHLTGDVAAAAAPVILKLQQHLPQQDYVIYGQCRKSTRRYVECTIGILKNKFWCLQNGLRVKTAKFSCEIFKCCVALHNLALKYRPITYPPADGAVLNSMGLEEEADTDSEENEEQLREAREILTSTQAGKRRRQQLVATFT